MKKQKSVGMVFMSTIIIMFILLNNVSYCAEPSDELKILLIDLKEWNAEQAEGSSVNLVGMNMINAIRNYSKEDKNLDVTILVGSSVMIQGQTQTINIETSDTKVITGEIDSFNVIQAFNKNENSGYIIITLEKGLTEGSLLMINYMGISSDEALGIAKKYNWDKMKSITSAMMD